MMPKDHRLNIRLDARLAKQVKALARRRNTTVSALIEGFLRQLTVVEKIDAAVQAENDAEQV